MNVVLLEPEIHYNTGNIGRTCVATGSRLHLIGPLGFSLDDRHIRRAGLDYWRDLKLSRYDGYDEFLSKNPGANIIMATTKGGAAYTNIRYAPDCFIMFGKESAGIPERILKTDTASCVRIPMLPGTRSLNLANSVAVILYEALRQNGFADLLQTSGVLKTDGE